MGRAVGRRRETPPGEIPKYAWAPHLSYITLCGPSQCIVGKLRIEGLGPQVTFGPQRPFKLSPASVWGPKFINLPNMNWIHTHQSWESPPSIAQQKLLLIVLGQCSDSAKLANSYWKCRVTGFKEVVELCFFAQTGGSALLLGKYLKQISWCAPTPTGLLKIFLM